MRTPPAQGGSIFKVALTAAAGSAIEWYDFFIYGTAAALVFPKLFFPADLSPLVAQLAAFSTFAVGFLARPVGGICFGHIGDRLGRKRALVLALMTMGLATTAVGLLPTYAQAGAIAPLLLVVLRFVQGLAVGGQWGGGALLAIESAPAGRTGFFGSFVQIGVPLGVVLANVVFLLVGLVVSPEAFQAWGWRLPFLLSIALVGVGIFVQLRLEDSIEFTEATEKGATTTKAAKAPSPTFAAIARYPRQIVLAGGAFIASNICFYIAITYVVAYGTSTLHVSKNVMLTGVMVGSVIMVPALMWFGALSDRWGRGGLFMAGAGLSALWAFAFFPLIETGSPLAITFAITVELVLLSLMYGPQAALFAELFPVEVRYSGASIGYQLGAVCGGGFAPIIAAALFARFGSSQPIAIYLCAACLLSLVSTYFLTRTRMGPATTPAG